MAREAAEARQADPDDSSDPPTAPNTEDDDDVSNPPNQDGDFAPNSLDNLDAIIHQQGHDHNVCARPWFQGGSRDRSL